VGSTAGATAVTLLLPAPQARSCNVAIIVHYINMSVAPIDRRLYFAIVARTPTIGDGRRAVGATHMFL